MRVNSALIEDYFCHKINRHFECVQQQDGVLVFMLIKQQHGSFCLALDTQEVLVRSVHRWLWHFDERFQIKNKEYHYFQSLGSYSQRYIILHISVRGILKLPHFQTYIYKTVLGKLPTQSIQVFGRRNSTRASQIQIPLFSGN